MTSSHASSQDFRLIDANLNRAAEGLRYLEDTSRFLLNDTGLTERLKTMRHALVESGWPFQKRLLEARDAPGDVAASLEVPGQEKPHDLPSSIVANARRVQEALRSMAEYAKVVSLASHLTPDKLEKARFELYDIEKDLLGKLLRKDKAERVRGIYVVIDSASLRGRRHADVTRQAIRGGASVIQLRDKNRDLGELLPIAREMKAVCAENNVPFIVNDYLDLALAAGADGLHVGQTDLPVAVVRRLAPLDMIIGCSVSDVPQALKAQADGADCVAPGAIFSTPTKESVPLGLELLRKVREAVAVPVVAIGGINAGNIAGVRAAGAHSAAVISAVLNAPDPEKATRELVRKFEVNDG